MYRAHPLIILYVLRYTIQINFFTKADPLSGCDHPSLELCLDILSQLHGQPESQTLRHTVVGSSTRLHFQSIKYTPSSAADLSVINEDALLTKYIDHTPKAIFQVAATDRAHSSEMTTATTQSLPSATLVQTKCSTIRSAKRNWANDLLQNTTSDIL